MLQLANIYHSDHMTTSGKCESLGYGSSSSQHHTAQPTARQIRDDLRLTQLKYSRTLFRLAIAESVMGGMSLVFGITTIFVGAWSPFTITAQGVWCGLFLIGNGLLKINARANVSTRRNHADMLLTILAIILAGIGVALSGFAAATSWYRIMAQCILHSIITLLLFGGFIISIIQLAFCCAGGCGRKLYP